MRRRAKASPNTKNPTAARITVNAHDVATIVGACSSSYSTLGVSTSRGVMLGSSRVTTPAAVNVTQARPSVDGRSIR